MVKKRRAEGRARVEVPQWKEIQPEGIPVTEAPAIPRAEPESSREKRLPILRSSLEEILALPMGTAHGTQKLAAAMGPAAGAANLINVAGNAP